MVLTTGLQQIIFAPEERIQVRHQPRVLILETFKNIPHLVERRKVRSLKIKICHRFTTHEQHKTTERRLHPAPSVVLLHTRNTAVSSKQRIATCTAGVQPIVGRKDHTTAEGGSRRFSRKHDRKLFQRLLLFGQWKFTVPCRWSDSVTRSLFCRFLVPSFFLVPPQKVSNEKPV